jgi:hypothetical protein
MFLKNYNFEFLNFGFFAPQCGVIIDHKIYLSSSVFFFHHHYIEKLGYKFQLHL